MLNKKTMINFTKQFIDGKVKLQKNKTIHGKEDNYFIAKNGLFISFEDHSVVVKVPNINIFIEQNKDCPQKTKNYINGVDKIIKMENKLRINKNKEFSGEIDGQIYTEILFKIEQNKFILDLFTVVGYFAIKQYPASVTQFKFGLMILEMPIWNRQSSEMIVKVKDNEKINSDFKTFESNYANEIINFKDLLEDSFIDQLNILEMALL